MFSYFLAEAETNTEILEMITEADIAGNEYRANTMRTRYKSESLKELENLLDHTKKHNQTDKLVRLCAKEEATRFDGEQAWRMGVETCSQGRRLQE